MPQMFWLSAGFEATPKLRFFYPMSRTIGHTTSEIADWPVHNGVDYSWDRNNKGMLGVFGIDFYDDFAGGYQFDRDYGLFRSADRRVVQGMKMWTFGYGPAAKGYERGYTDNAGPYIELQSGRYVWDGNYEWVGPHRTEEWSEWWVPVAGTGGITSLTRHAALNLQEQTGGTTDVILAVTKRLHAARLSIGDRESVVDLDPAKPYKTSAGIATAAGLHITLTDAAGAMLLDYRRPERDPRRPEYTPFTRPLEEPRKTPAEMSVEELTLAAEAKLKQLNGPAAVALLEQALARDPGYSRAHLLLGQHHFAAGRYQAAAEYLEKVLARDPYSDEGCYYLAMSLLALGQTERAEHHFYYIWPLSAYFGAREFQLGRLALLRRDAGGAEAHLERAVAVSGYDLSARLLLALVLREQGRRPAAGEQLDAVTRLDPANPIAQAERHFLATDGSARPELLRLLGGQTQEALSVSQFYRDVARWKDAIAILKLAESARKDPFGTPPEFYYVLASCQRQAGDSAAAAASRAQARAAAGRVDRFPYREENIAPLEEAVAADPQDAVARSALACLLYSRGRPAEAIRLWEAAAAIDPGNFSTQRALGLAYAEQGAGIGKAAPALEHAIALAPVHTPTFNDLSSLYSAAGRFDAQIQLIEKALAAKPGDDSLTESLFAALLHQGRYADAGRLVETHAFAPRHRTYGLRDKYRLLRAATAAQAYRKAGYEEALRLADAALMPPVSLGLDDFQNQASPRIEYLRGRILEAAGRGVDARAAYERAASGIAAKEDFSAEDFFAAPALRRLGRVQDAIALERRLEALAQTDRAARGAARRANGSYLAGLLREYAGQAEEAREFFTAALQARPDLLAARVELRGDTLPAPQP
jgi:tetratricopeptide (TPR) repeat protein